MKEILIKFENEKLQKQFIDEVIILQLKTQEVFHNNLNIKIEYDFENDICIVNKK